MGKNDLIKEIREIIAKDVIVHSSKKDKIISGEGNPISWIFNFRNILLDSHFLDLSSDLFWENFKDKYPFQVGGLESAALPFITSILIKGLERGTPLNGFYIRKSRKPDGIQRIIEGKLTSDPIILVDDLINSGSSFVKQIEVLKNEDKKPDSIFAFVRFHDAKKYSFLTNAGIKIVTPFSLSDFNITNHFTKEVVNKNIFSVDWVKKISNPNYFYRVPKSTPVLDEKKIYLGSDSGIMWAFDQETGQEIWRFKIYGLGVKGKTIFSSPAIHKKTLYFGAYDGNFYALDTETGKKNWVYMDADWIGSSPVVASDLNMVYVGLEFGLWNKKGGVVALDAVTGEKKWEYIDMPEYTHSSPAYSQKYKIVVVGSNDGVVYAFNAQNGNLLWKYQTNGEVKSSFCFDEKRGYLIFGSFDGNIYIISVKNGGLISCFQTEAGIFSTPCVYEDRVYFSSLDKKIYCLNLKTFDIEWVFRTSGRVFASPSVIQGSLYIGSNDGCLYKVGLVSGENKGIFQTTERITNKIVYNSINKRFFLYNYANELFCLRAETHEEF